MNKPGPPQGDKPEDQNKTPEENRAEKLDSSAFSIKDMIGQRERQPLPNSLKDFGADPQISSSSSFSYQSREAGRSSYGKFGLSRDLNKELRRDLKPESLIPHAKEDGFHSQNRMNKEFVWQNAERQLDSDSNMGLRVPMGLRQYFQLRKSEFIKPKEGDDASLELKNEVEKFLSQTPVRDDKRRTAAENRDLAETRNALLNSITEDEALSNALHLARLYQHLRYIEESRKAVSLALSIKPEDEQVRQVFKELERMHPIDIGIATPVAVPLNITKSSLRKRIRMMGGGKVIVLGDLLIDELLEGRPERISREAPVLILEHVDTVLIPGGAANTANNIAALGGTCHAIGVCGADEYAGKLANLLEGNGISHDLVADPSRPTTVKTRILSKSHSLMQQLLRLDRISHDRISAAVESALIAKLTQSAAQYKAVILSDYKGGVITDGVIEACRLAQKSSPLMVIVDAQGDFRRFKNLTLMTPNQPDTEKAVGYPLNSRQALEQAGKDLLQQTGLQALLITRGGEGMALFEQGKPMVELPAFNRSDVFDVTGAGDTVVATMALALVTGASFAEAMALGNLAASIVVRKSGTAVTSQMELMENLERLNLAE